MISPVFREREHDVLDIAVLLAVTSLALASWSYFSDAADISLWKTYTSVATAGLLALATLTRHPRWAAGMRCLTGGWMMAAPYVLGFAAVAPALRAYLILGALVVTFSIPSFIASRTGRTRMA